MASRSGATAGEDLVAADWRDFYEERAAIRESYGGYQRRAAEILAFNDCIKTYRLTMKVTTETAARRLERMGIGR
jgi:hypothetical protein